MKERCHSKYSLLYPIHQDFVIHSVETAEFFAFTFFEEAVEPCPKGSAGGHNGLKNISELLGTEEYARMRFGVGGDFPKGHQVEYVLGEWTDEERKALPERLKVFVDAIRSFATVGTQLTMTNFNKK